MKEHLFVRLSIFSFICLIALGTSPVESQLHAGDTVASRQAVLEIQDNLKPFFETFEAIDSKVKKLEQDWGLKKISASNRYEDDLESWQALSTQLQNLIEALGKKAEEDDQFFLDYDEVFCSLGINPFGSTAVLESIEGGQRRLELWGTYWGSKVASADDIAKQLSESFDAESVAADAEMEPAQIEVNFGDFLNYLAYNIAGTHKYLEVLAEKGVGSVTVEGFDSRPVKSLAALVQRLRDFDLAIDRLTPHDMQGKFKMNHILIRAGKDERVEIEASARRLNLFVREDRLDPSNGHDTTYSEQIQKFLEENNLVRLRPTTES